MSESRGLFGFGHQRKTEEYDDAPPQSDSGYGDDQPSSDYGYEKRKDQYSGDTDYSAPQSGGGYGDSYGDKATDGYGQTTTYGDDGEEKAQADLKSAKRNEHLGELGAAAAGAYALYERYEAKKDPEHAGRHKIEEEVAAVAAVGAGGYAFHEHHQKKEAEQETEEYGGEKKHSFF